MENDATVVRLNSPIEYLNAICLDNNMIVAGQHKKGITTDPVNLVGSNDPDEQDDTFKVLNLKIQEETITSEATEHASNNNEVVSENKEGTKLQVSEKNKARKDVSKEFTVIRLDDSSDDESADNREKELSTVTRLEDFMDVVTTYKCKFCRFSCPWKSGLMSHIRCCHVESKKALVPSEKEKAGSSIIKGVVIKEEPQSSAITKSDAVDQNSSTKAKEINERHIFLCGQCSEGFMSLECCKQHMIKDHDLKLENHQLKPLKKRGRPRKNPVTDSSPDGNENSTKERKRQAQPSENQEELDVGKRKARKEFLTSKVFRCTHNGCSQRFSRESHLEYHYSCHSSGDKPFICPSCNEPFEHWRILVIHLWKRHNVDIDLFSCSDCDYKTYSYFKLDNHKKIHGEERAYICQQCGKGFKQISQLRNHLVIHLDRKNLPNKRWYSEQQCETCGRKFSDAKCLRKHQQAVHNKLKPYVCTYCGHLSARKAMLELHMRQHTGEKPFLCEHCDYRTGDHNSLRRHRMRHTGDKPYKCPHCPYACIQAISYKTHLKNKHPGMDGLYACSVCTFKSVSKENYMNHMVDHKHQPTNVTGQLLVDDPRLFQADPNSDQASVQMELTGGVLEQLEGVLPNNITAAQLIYSCLNALSQDGGTVNLPPGVTVNIPPSTEMSPDGTQTITIQLPITREAENEPYYFTIQQQDGTTALVLPKDVQDEQLVFAQDDPSSAKVLLESSILPVDDNQQVGCGNAESLVIAHVESLADSESMNDGKVSE